MRSPHGRSVQRSKLLGCIQDSAAHLPVELARPHLPRRSQSSQSGPYELARLQWNRHRRLSPPPWRRSLERGLFLGRIGEDLSRDTERSFTEASGKSREL